MSISISLEQRKGLLPNQKVVGTIQLVLKEQSLFKNITLLVQGIEHVSFRKFACETSYTSSHREERLDGRNEFSQDNVFLSRKYDIAIPGVERSSDDVSKSLFDKIYF